MDRLPSMVFGALWNNAIIKEVVSKEFRNAGFAGVKITPMPLQTRIIVIVDKPSRAVAKIKEVINILKSYGIENPTIEIQKNKDITNPQAIACRLAILIEKLPPTYVKRRTLMRLKNILEENGVRGIEIIIKGRHTKLDKKVKERYVWGQIKKVGECVKTLVSEGYTYSIPKMGMTSIRVRIIKKDVRFPDEIEIKGDVDVGKIQEAHRRIKRNVKRRTRETTE